jgi:ATP-dependent helicase HrpB
VEARDPMLRSRRDDWALRWQALAAFRQGARPADANRGALAAIDQAARSGVGACAARRSAAGGTGARARRRAGARLPDRIARQHAGDPRRYQLANGRMARLADDSALYGEPWLVASELRFEARDALVLRAAPVDEARLRADFPQRFVERDFVRWECAGRAPCSRGASSASSAS